MVSFPSTDHAPVSHELPKLIFDLGGVLIDWRPNVFIKDLIPDKDLTDSELSMLMKVVFQDYGPDSDWVAFDLNRIDLETLAERIEMRSAQVTNTPPIEKKMVLDWILGLGCRLQILEDSLEWLTELKHQGHRLFFLSNMPKLFIAHISRHRRLFDLFDDGIFSGEVSLAKPDPKIYKLAQDRFFGDTSNSKQPHTGSTWGSIIFFDDNDPNVLSAMAFGWDAILFSNADQAKHDLRSRFKA